MTLDNKTAALILAVLCGGLAGLFLWLMLS